MAHRMGVISGERFVRVDVVIRVWIWLGVFVFFFFFQAEDGIRDLVRSRGLGDVYKRQTALIPLATDAII